MSETLHKTLVFEHELGAPADAVFGARSRSIPVRSSRGSPAVRNRFLAEITAL